MGDALAGIRGGGRIGLITAGWQEWEEDDAWLREAVGGAAVNLELYRRAEAVWRDDPELAGAHRVLQGRVRQLRRAYNVRLSHRMDAWIAVEGLAGDEGVLAAERASALEDVRALDAHHLRRIDDLRGEFEERWRPGERHAVARERHALGEFLHDVSALVVAGGHVPALLNRLRLLDVRPHLASRPVAAWGGGAMVLGERVVLFHDSPPWGPGHAEVGERGLGLVSGVVPLPEARQRLRTDDPGRVSRMSRRFAPDVCLLLDPGVRALWDEGRWVDGAGDRLGDGGALEKWRAVA